MSIIILVFVCAV